jgi:hypothetical protein
MPRPNLVSALNVVLPSFPCVLAAVTRCASYGASYTTVAGRGPAVFGVRGLGGEELLVEGCGRWRGLEILLPACHLGSEGGFLVFFRLFSVIQRSGQRDGRVRLPGVSGLLLSRWATLSFEGQGK